MYIVYSYLEWLCIFQTWPNSSFVVDGNEMTIPTVTVANLKKYKKCPGSLTASTPQILQPQHLQRHLMRLYESKQPTLSPRYHTICLYHTVEDSHFTPSLHRVRRGAGHTFESKHTPCHSLCHFPFHKSRSTISSCSLFACFTCASCFHRWRRSFVVGFETEQFQWSWNHRYLTSAPPPTKIFNAFSPSSALFTHSCNILDNPPYVSDRHRFKLNTNIIPKSSANS